RAARRADRLFVVGLGGCEPRHDAARVPAGSAASGVLRAGLWWQWRVLFAAGGTAACRAHRGQGQATDAAGFHYASAWASVCAVPANWAKDALFAVFQTG